MENQHEIIKKIESENPELLAEAIQEIKENGDLNMAKMLLECLPNIQETHTKNVLLNLLADIKENAFKEVLIHQIQATTHSDAKTELLRIVWESSLNYTEYLPMFLDMILNEEFATAFEASTVIENMLHNLTSEQLETLHQFIEACPTDKRFLVDSIHAEMGCCEND